MSDLEEAIAKAQLKGGAGVGKHQGRSIAHLDERIFVFLGGIAFLGLCLVWATARSGWILYGSLALTILLVILWGVARVKRLERIRQERAMQAREVQSKVSN